MAQLNTRLVLRNDTTGNWSSADANSNLVLLKGEIGIEYDSTGKVKMKVGDGTTNWSALSYFGGEEANVYQVDSYNALPTTDVAIGDTGIVKTLISGDKYSYTGYVYSENGWVAMDGNYNAENVYFDENIIVTRTVGNVETSNNTPVEIACEGKNIKQLFEILYSTEDLDIATDTPSVSFTLSSNGSGEVGTNFTRPTATLKITDIGSYEYGSKDSAGTKYANAATGITFNKMKVAGGVTTQAKVESATSSMQEKTNKNYGVNESLSYTATESDISSTVLTDTKVTYDFAYVTDYTASAHKPLTNLGNFKKSSTESTTNYNEGIGAIPANTLFATKQWSAQGTRYWFYGYRMATAIDGVDNSGPLADPTKITSAEVRALPTALKTGYAGGKVTSAPSTFKVPAGTKQVYFVFPAGKKNSLSVVNKSALSAPVACTVVKKAVSVEGANGYAGVDYDLFYINVDGQFGSDAELGLTWG